MEALEDRLVPARVLPEGYLVAANGPRLVAIYDPVSDEQVGVTLGQAETRADGTLRVPLLDPETQQPLGDFYPLNPAAWASVFVGPATPTEASATDAPSTNSDGWVTSVEGVVVAVPDTATPPATTSTVDVPTNDEIRDAAQAWRDVSPNNGTATLLYKPWEHEQGAVTLEYRYGQGDEGAVNAQAPPVGPIIIPGRGPSVGLPPFPRDTAPPIKPGNGHLPAYPPEAIGPLGAIKYMRSTIKYMRSTTEGPVEITREEYYKDPTKGYRIQLQPPTIQSTRDAAGREFLSVVRYAVITSYGGLEYTWGAGPDHRCLTTKVLMDPLIEYFPEDRKDQARIDLANGMSKEAWEKKYFKEIAYARVNLLWVFRQCIEPRKAELQAVLNSGVISPEEKAKAEAALKEIEAFEGQLNVEATKARQVVADIKAKLVAIRDNPATSEADRTRAQADLKAIEDNERAIADLEMKAKLERWVWKPINLQPLPPRQGGSAPSGDIGDLQEHIRRIRRQGATIQETEQVWIDGMRLIAQRAAAFPGNTPVENNFYGVVGGEWRVYVGRPAVAGGDTFAIAFNTRTGAIAIGLRSGIRPSPSDPSQEALFNFRVIYP